jgi:hypothetical protein
MTFLEPMRKVEEQETDLCKRKQVFGPKDAQIAPVNASSMLFICTCQS